MSTTLAKNEVFAPCAKFDAEKVYSFDEVLDNGAYTYILEKISVIINIIGHAGPGTHLIIDNRVHAFSNKNAISILKNSQINVYHDKTEKIIRVKKISDKYDHKITFGFS